MLKMLEKLENEKVAKGPIIGLAGTCVFFLPIHFDNSYIFSLSIPLLYYSFISILPNSIGHYVSLPVSQPLRFSVLSF